MEWIIVSATLVFTIVYLQRPSIVRDRKRLAKSLDLEGWLDARYALRFNEAKHRYELLDFIRWDHDTKDAAHCLYLVNDIRCGRDEEEPGCERDCMLVVHVDGAEQKILVDNRFDFDCTGFCGRTT
jgi:hypothetical protein